LITVINRPLGHRLTDQELPASVTDSGGEALFTTASSHGLSQGDYIYVISNFDAYNGFKYIYSPTYNTFKLKEFETGDVVEFKQVTDLEYRVSVLEHGWSAVNQPIVYEIESDLYPNNVDEEAYTPNVIVSQADSNGYTLLNLSAALSDPTALAWIELVGSGELAGPYQILSAPQAWQVVINLAYDASNILSGYQVVKYYKNYCMNVQVWAGLGADHLWYLEKPYELAATLQFVPDENGRAKFSIAEILRGYITTRNNLTLDTLPNNLDFMVAFYIETFESYDQSDGTDVTTFNGEVSEEDDFTGHAVNASMPFKSLYQSFMSEYVNESTETAAWLSIQDEPVTIVGYFFDLSFLNINPLGDIEIYSSGDLHLTITNPGVGVIRVPLDDLTAGEHCIQAVRAAIPGFTPDTMDAIATWTNVDTGGPAWVVTGGVPEIDFNGLGLSVESDDWHTDYAFEEGQIYTFDYEFKGSNSAGTFYIEIVDAGGTMIIEKVIPTNPESQVGNYTFMAPAGAAGITIWFDNPASCGGECLARIISFENMTETDAGTPSEAITEEICVTVLEECDDSVLPGSDDIRLLEDGDFRLLE
jgi:hypothetical protein